MWEQIKQAIIDWFVDLKEWFFDVMFVIFDSMLNIFAKIIDAIPLPSFINNFNLANYIGNDVAYFLMMSQFDVALSIMGAGIAFYILRRFLTLGIW